MIDQIRTIGHQGYVTSDTGVLTATAWGVQDLDHRERVDKAINADTDGNRYQLGHGLTY